MPWFSHRPWARCWRGLLCALALQAALLSAVAVSAGRESLRAELLRAQPQRSGAAQPAQRPRAPVRR